MLGKKTALSSFKSPFFSTSLLHNDVEKVSFTKLRLYLIPSVFLPYRILDVGARCNFLVDFVSGWYEF